MSDFADLVQVTFGGSPGLRPGLEDEPLDDRIEALDTRMHTVSNITWIGVPLTFVIALVMLLLIATAEPTTEAKWLVLESAVFVWAIIAIAMIKLWHFQMQSDVAMMKETLRIQAMLLGNQ
jgi:hypothetical protein